MLPSARPTSASADGSLMASLRGLDRDARLLFALRMLRLFGYGFLAVILVLYWQLPGWIRSGSGWS